MAPTLAKPFHRQGWVYEEKYDGVHAPLLSISII
jgi:hypothetical protein